MPLNANEHRAVFREFMSDLSSVHEPMDIMKADLFEAVVALDDYLEKHAAQINQAFPIASRQTLSVPQKARLLNYVVRERFIRGA